ncbi:major facilitator superfamily protein [Stylonychia lemnae]|uniref:Major facilitator superfamily protein n=1 Tax=Stylonychia lemnae TaxID=5949 RepID=A0A078AD65_STYLE|nr:major facilitator superfamily protein [Stylonychia lemnae]|eukprot:CDW79472.1 major facilitator superfamily protein [Stylonychia lemnae]
MSSSNYEKLGFFCFSLDFLCYGIGCLSASFFVDKLGVKFCLSISATADTLWILAIIPPALSTDKTTNNDMFIRSNGFIYTTQILIQIIQGFCLGLKWVAGSKYISECATEETKGFYFSLYWGLFMVSMVLGSLIAAFVTIHFEKTKVLLIMAAIAAFSIFIFITLTKPIPQERYLPVDNQLEEVQILKQQEDDSLKTIENRNNFRDIPKNNLKFEQSKHFDNENNMLTAQNQKQSGVSISLRKEMQEVLHLIQTKKMLPLIPQLLWVGISIAVYSGILVIIIIDTEKIGDDQYKFSQSMLTMVSFGAGEIMGSIFSGWMIDKYGNKKTALLNVILVSIYLRPNFYLGLIRQFKQYLIK